MSLAPGTRIGPYEVIDPLGQGGMGEVYRALDINLKRWVAVKVLPEAVAEDADRLARFQREAEVLAALNHPNIAHVYGFERSISSTPGSAGVTALVMELVEGPTLADRIAGSPMPLDEALSIARQIAEALEAAHGRGIIHRDLKPANIKVRDDGRVKVLDFGLAKPTAPLSPSPDRALSESPTATSPLIGAAPAAWSTVTAHGMIVGTAAYMSPEQARAKPVDKRSDIWSFGCVLFEMLSGRRPFQGATLADVLVAVLSKEPDWTLVAGVAPPHVVRLLRHCLEKDPARRLRDIGDAQLDLEASDSPARSALFPVARGRTFWILAAAAVTTVAIVGAMAWRWLGQPGSSEIIWRSRAVVTSSSEEFDSRISPDGRWMSFLSSAGGKTQLLVQRLDAGEVRPVTVPAGDVLSQMWSPDGSQFAYVLRQGTSAFLQIVPAFFGGVPVQSIGLRPAPNDVRLVRWIGRAIYIQAHHDTGRSLQRIDLDAGDIANVSQGWPFKGNLRGFDVSADGAAVAFSAVIGGQEDLWLTDLQGTSAKQLTNDAFLDSEPLFSRDSSAVVFRTNRGGQFDLWQVDLLTGRFLRLTSSESEEEPESSTADGNVVSFRQVSGDSNLFTWDPSKSTVVDVTDDALSDFAPTSTSDGSMVVFQRAHPSATPTLRNPLANSTLFVGAFDGLRFRSEPTAITDGFAAQLSPDGSRLAYLRRQSDARTSALLVRHLGSGETITLSATCPEPSFFPSLHEWADHNFAWNASGTELFFVDRPDVYAVRRYQVGGPVTGPPLVVAQANEIIHDLQLSPTGELAYLVRAKGGSILHFIDSRTGQSLGALQFQGTVSARGWLPGEKGVVVARATRFQSDFTADVEVLVVSATGAIRNVGVVPSAFVVTTRLDATRSVLYVARQDGTGRNLYEISLQTGRVRAVTDNTLPGVSFAGVVPLSGGALMGVRHQQRSDIWLLDATSLAGQSASSSSR